MSMGAQSWTPLPPGLGSDPSRSGQVEKVSQLGKGVVHH